MSTLRTCITAIAATAAAALLLWAAWPAAAENYGRSDCLFVSLGAS